MRDLSQEEQEYLDACQKIYNELSNTELEKSLRDLRERTITRVARLNTDREVWKELGKLYIIDLIIEKKNGCFNEIKRLNAEINGD